LPCKSWVKKGYINRYPHQFSGGAETED